MKRLELLPEEALYLVERGSMFCWKDEEDGSIKPMGVDGTPMTVQQAYAEMIGKGGLTLERYQVCSFMAVFSTAVI
jgi:tRNA-splicing endonuclease subunit Sen54